MNASSLRGIHVTVVGFLGTLVFAVDIAGSIVQNASPVEKAPATASSQRLPSYFANTEELGRDEMRITALGTGLPTPLTQAQKSTAFTVELGNGEVFLFDIGSGTMENIFGYGLIFRRWIRSS